MGVCLSFPFFPRAARPLSLWLLSSSRPGLSLGVSYAKPSSCLVEIPSRPSCRPRRLLKLSTTLASRSPMTHCSYSLRTRLRSKTSPELPLLPPAITKRSSILVAIAVKCPPCHPRLPSPSPRLVPAAMYLIRKRPAIRRSSQAAALPLPPPPPPPRRPVVLILLPAPLSLPPSNEARAVTTVARSSPPTPP